MCEKLEFAPRAHVSLGIPLSEGTIDNMLAEMNGKAESPTRKSKSALKRAGW
jgi:hypothetical protein